MTISEENKRTDKTPLGTIISILSSFEILSRFLELGLRDHDATLIRFNIMTALYRNGGEMTPSELAESVFRGKNTITAALNTLEAEGVLRREPSPDDRRSVRVVITDKGWNVANRLNPVVQQLSREALSCLDRDQEEQLVDIMRTLRGSLLPKITKTTGNGKRHTPSPNNTGPQRGP